ncbi:MAG: hypothetical protein WBE20_12870 [Candidatus Acidiferrales bacterium]
MRKFYGNISRWLCSLLLVGGFAAFVAMGGCAAHGYYRVYDPEYRDYHVWNHDEVVYYQQWEHDTHRRHVDFKRRNQDEQNQYWNWRHQHGDHH